MNLNTVKEETFKALKDLKTVQRWTEWDRYYCLESVIYDDDNIEETTKLYQLEQIMNLIDQAIEIANDLESPIEEEGLIQINELDQLMIGSHVLHAGTPIEILDESATRWIGTRIEYSHDKQAYYIYSRPSLNPIGIRARIKDHSHDFI